MKFAYRPPAHCAGMMLGHSVALGNTRLRKGHWLSEEDVKALLQAGFEDVFAGAREVDDVLENDAALSIAKHVSGPLVAYETAHTGRCNLIAQAAGLLTYERGTLIALNLVDARITLAMLPPSTPVRPGDLVGTVKIIPFAVPEQRLKAALAAWDTPANVCVAPFRTAQAHLLETTLPRVKALSEKIIGFTRDRAQRVGFALNTGATAPHRPSSVARWLAQAAGQAAPEDVLLVFGASATVDEADVIPQAIIEAGGRVDRIGMAADPGNLLVFGTVDAIPVIGLPGCAKSPALNGFDWVLERVAAGMAITEQEWAEFAVGGLLKEIEARPQPRRAGNEP